MNSDLEEVWGWLQTWWSRAGEIVANYDLSPPADPWAWDGWVSAGVFRIPSAVAGVETAPFVELLKAIVSLWEPGPEHGPRRTKEDLWALSSAAWTAYNRLEAMAAAELESEDSPTDTAEGATQPAGPAIVEGPAASPERAAAANPGSALPASPVAAEGAQGASGAGGDSGEVNAKALADHCGCSDRQIRKVLSHFAPSREGNRGQLWWRYGLILKTLRQWSAGTESKRKKYNQWPENAAELQKRKKPHPERSKK